MADNLFHKYDLIDNYIYFYHLDTYLLIPAYMESIVDTSKAEFSQTSILSRSAPIFSYAHSGPRTMNFQIHLHRDIMQMINTENNSTAMSKYKILKGADLDADFTDVFVKYMQASVLPSYDTAKKMVNPPIIAVRLGNDIFIKGVVGSVSVGYGFPIDRNGRYSKVDVSFNISEITPYDAEQVLEVGSLRTTLERDIYKV